MKQEIDLFKQAGGVTHIRYWSGGNLYPNVYEAAKCAGPDVNSDWKNPQMQSTDLALVGVNPWRGANSTNGTDFKNDTGVSLKLGHQLLKLRFAAAN